MGSFCVCLMCSSPERPCDDVGRLDAALCELDGDAPDFLDGPADQMGFGLRTSALMLFGGASALALWRMTAIMAKASMTRLMCRCQPCQERVSL
jgi:hypothetical protein